LVSGEGVAIDLRRAGLGSRTVAGVIDLAIEIGVLLLVVAVTSAVGAGDPAVQAAVAVVETVLVLAGYPIAFEWLTRGRTLGKMTLGLRVVRDDGGPIGFRQALVRGLAGLFLEKPGITVALGMITIGVSKSSKRVGDMMAGTFVVNERTGSAPTLVAVNWYVPPALYGWAQALDLTRVDDQLALQVRQFIVRAAQMSPSAQTSLGEQFRAELLSRTAPPPPPGVPTPVLLTTVLAERRRRAEWALTAPGRPDGSSQGRTFTHWPTDSAGPPNPSQLGETFAPPS
jgi:uncharacterized RDD family membrane protein YckC